MPDNRGVAYIGAGKVEVQNIDFPELELKDGPGVHPDNVGRKTPHGAILKIVSTNICGSDQHMVRGRTTAPENLILGHEITGEVIEAGPGVEFIKEGDLCSVPFNIACGRCSMCKDGHTGVCLNTNPDRPRIGVRVRGHGRLGGRPGGVRDGPVRRLEPAQVPRQGPGHGEDPGPDDAVGHLPHRIPRLRDGRGYHGVDGLHRRRGPGGPGRGALGAAAGRRRGDRRRHADPAARSGEGLRLRDGGPEQGHARGGHRADPGRAGRGRRRGLRGLRGPRPRRGCG